MNSRESTYAFGMYIRYTLVGGWTTTGGLLLAGDSGGIDNFSMLFTLDKKFGTS